jgi:hypothetical protein
MATTKTEGRMATRKTPKRPGTTTINFDRDVIHSKMDQDGKDHLVINETVRGKTIKILEVERRVGPLGANDNNNNLC